MTEPARRLTRRTGLSWDSMSPHPATLGKHGQPPAHRRGGCFFICKAVWNQRRATGGQIGTHFKRRRVGGRASWHDLGENEQK